MLCASPTTSDLEGLNRRNGARHATGTQGSRSFGPHYNSPTANVERAITQKQGGLYVGGKNCRHPAYCSRKE